jgi:hypothetical protein
MYTKHEALQSQFRFLYILYALFTLINAIIKENFFQYLFYNFLEIIVKKTMLFN